MKQGESTASITLLMRVSWLACGYFRKLSSADMGISLTHISYIRNYIHT